MKLLGPLVFCCGAVIMAVEIVGVRLLAPHFGVSVYVWGSILTVFMAALASGYWLGGRIADAAPSFAVLNVLVLIGAVLTALVPYIAHPLARPLEGLGEKWGPLVASIELFWLPSMCLATVSPFAVRLVVSAISRVGNVAGSLYAFSTVGSIAGSWVTTFILIGSLSLTKILVGCAALLGVLVAINLLLVPRRASKVLAPVGGALVLALFIGDAAGAWEPDEGDVLIDEADTPYHHIFIVDGLDRAWSKPGWPKWEARSMYFDRYKESGIWLQPPYHSSSLYTDAFHLAGWVSGTRNPARACFIGAGGGLGPRTFRKRWPQMEIDVVDIDPMVLAMCEEHFYLGAADDPLMHTHTIDGRVFIRQQTARFAEAQIQGYDIVVLDAFTVGGRIPWHLTTTEYFREIRASLSRRGVLVMNVIGAIEPPEPELQDSDEDMSTLLRSIYKSMGAAYGPSADMPGQGHIYAFPVNWSDRWRSDPSIPRNVMLVATNGSEPLPQELLRAEAQKFDQSGILGRPVVTIVDDMLDAAYFQRVMSPEDGAPLLTDEFCPVDIMPFYEKD